MRKVVKKIQVSCSGLDGPSVRRSLTGYTYKHNNLYTAHTTAIIILLYVPIYILYYYTRYIIIMPLSDTPCRTSEADYSI